VARHSFDRQHRRQFERLKPRRAARHSLSSAELVVVRRTTVRVVPEVSRTMLRIAEHRRDLARQPINPMLRKIGERTVAQHRVRALRTRSRMVPRIEAPQTEAPKTEAPKTETTFRDPVRRTTSPTLRKIVVRRRVLADL
jgi:hypothetical protein